jgi:hypothetical protein
MFGMNAWLLTLGERWLNDLFSSVWIFMCHSSSCIAHSGIGHARHVYYSNSYSYPDEQLQLAP